MALGTEFWKYSEGTQDLIRKIDKRISEKKDEITDFGGLIRSPELIREYCVAIGAISELKEIKKLIEESNDDETT